MSELKTDRKLGLSWSPATGFSGFDILTGNDNNDDGGGGAIGNIGGGLMSWLFGENWATWARLILGFIVLGFVMKIGRMLS